MMAGRCKKCGDRKPGDRVLMDRLRWGGDEKRYEEWATITSISGHGVDQLIMAAAYSDGGEAWQGDRVLWGCICSPAAPDPNPHPAR